MSHEVIGHHVCRVPISLYERTAVRAAILATNQFVLDNYDVDKSRTAFIAETMSGESLFPLNKSVISDFMVYLKASNTAARCQRFLVSLRLELDRNGISLGECEPRLARS